jgi:hypothetical protein
VLGALVGAGVVVEVEVMVALASAKVAGHVASDVVVADVLEAVGRMNGRLFRWSWEELLSWDWRRDQK